MDRHPVAEDSPSLAAMQGDREQVERFLAAWQSVQAPTIKQYLRGDSGDYRPLLMELVLADMKCRAARGWKTCVEMYLREFPDLEACPEDVLALVGAEWALRSDDPEPERFRAEYEARFPRVKEALRRLPAPTPRASGGANVNTVPYSPSFVAPTTVSGGQEKRFPTIPGFEILSELGRGGMGVVYLARQTSLARLVALKVLRPSVAEAEGGVERFLREARSVAALSHRNVIQVYESGLAAGVPYIALEFVQGGSLAQRAGAKPLAAREAAELMEGAARGVQHAHEKGIIHRDLTPGNVLLMADGTPRVGDFGLARQVQSGIDQTRTGEVLGTPPYMAPEQARGQKKEIGQRTDVYGLGSVLYHLLTGQPPFLGATTTETLLQVIGDDPVGPRRRNRAVPHDLETICLKCLHKCPAKRYASAGELADDLRRWLDGDTIHARRPTLRERLTRLRRRRPTASALVLMSLSLALLAGFFGLWYWNRFKRETFEYYSSYINRHGVKEGVNRLSPAEVRGRSYSYRFRVRGGRVEQVDVVNGTGALTTRHGSQALLAPGEGGPASQECQYVYKRNQQGELLEERALARNNNVLWVLHYTTPTTAHYTNAQGIPRAAGVTGTEQAGKVSRGRSKRLRSVEGMPQPQTRSGATYLRVVRSESGLDLELHYLDRSGERRPDDSGVWGKRFERNDRGLVTCTTYLGEDGGPTLHNRDKIASLRFAYDERGNVVDVACFDTVGKPCLHRDGIQRWTKKYDNRGNVVEWAYFDTDDKPCLHKDGFHRSTRRYDERGNLVEVACFSAEGKPCLHKDEVHRWTKKYDERGNEVEWAYYGTDEKPCLHKDGYHRSTRRYDERGNAREVAYFGADDTPCLHKDGYHRSTRWYGERGNVLEWACFGTDGKPCLDKSDGTHRTSMKYDERGNKVEVACFDIEGKPCLHKNSFHRSTRRYDERGNAVVRAFYGTDGKPCLCEDGFHRAMLKYDERGNVSEWACFGVNAEPCTNKRGPHRITRNYDERGNEVEWACFGTDGKACLHKDNFHRYMCRYDERGNQVEWACFDAEGKPCLDQSDGTHRTSKKYGERGNEVEVACFGADGKPCLNRDGVYRWTTKYDERGNVVVVAYFDTEGKPCLDKDGFHRSTHRYDERGNEVEWACFGTDDKPCLDQSDGTHRTSKKYGERGNEVEVACFGADGKPCLNRDGVYRWTTKYDGRGNVVEEAYYGTDEKPCLHKDGFHRSTRRYDQRGNVVESAYFGTEGKPCLRKGGYHKTKRGFDERGNEVALAFFGTDDLPCRSAQGVHKTTRRYDERGNELERRRFGIDGKPCALNGGFHRVTFHYDALSRKREQTEYAVTGELRLTQRYNEEGDAIRAIWYADQALKQRYGAAVARREQSLGDKEEVVEEVFVDEAGLPVQTLAGYARFRTNSEAGQPPRRTYFDRDGKVVATQVRVEGVAPASQGEQFGLRPGDVLLRYEGQPITHAVVFVGQHAKARQAKRLRTLVILRGDKERSVSLATGPHGLDLLDVALSRKPVGRGP